MVVFVMFKTLITPRAETVESRMARFRVTFVLFGGTGYRRLARLRAHGEWGKGGLVWDCLRFKNTHASHAFIEETDSSFCNQRVDTQETDLGIHCYWGVSCQVLNPTDSVVTLSHRSCPMTPIC